MSALAAVLLALGNPPVTVVDRPSRNAWADHGAIIVTRSLVKATTDAELAFVIAHEMAHFEKPGKGKAAELAADIRAVEITRKAGFDPAAGARYLRRTDYFRTGGSSHPTNECRALAVEALTQ